MKTIDIVCRVRQYAYDELTPQDRALVDAARAATQSSYAPYSRFHVGAAARLAGGLIVAGSNQESVAFPSGLCAERVCLFACAAQHSGVAVEALAIAARRDDGETPQPVTPCGACRQVILDVCTRQGRPLRVLLYGRDAVYEADARDLLPLAFDNL